jgi:hypothetical protein
MYPKNRKISQIYTRKTHFYKIFPFAVKKTTEFVREEPLTKPLIIKKLAQFLVKIV